MTRRDQLAWAAALRNVARLGDKAPVNDLGLQCAGLRHVGDTGDRIRRAFNRWLRLTLTTTVARKIVARATGKRGGK